MLSSDFDYVPKKHAKRRSTRACYPCAKRKVRCEGGQPCKICVINGHPELCYDDQGNRSRRKTNTRSAITQQPPFSGGIIKNQSPASHHGSNHDTVISTEPHVGRYSAINFVRQRIDNPRQKDIHAGIGLGNSSSPETLATPFETGSTDDRSLDEMMPKREEALHFFPPFRDLVMHLYPVVPDPKLLESLVCDMLSDDSATIAPQPGVKGVHLDQIAVILACLALGAQFSESNAATRYDAARDLVNRASTLLKRANYIFQPTLQAVQALIMIGIVYQNLGQSDGAWIMLGLTYRLAQSLDMHKSLSSPSSGEDHNTNASQLWKAILWQDALLSLRYDRLPLSTEVYHETDSLFHHSTGLSYFEAMRWNCAIGLELQGQDVSQRSDAEWIWMKCGQLDHIIFQACDHLRVIPLQRSFQQRTELLLLRFHTAFLQAEICRPGFPNSADIRKAGLRYLQTVVTAYLDLCAIGCVPLRSWSLSQAVASCALVLVLLGDRHASDETGKLLWRLIDVLKKEAQSDSGSAHPSEEQLQGLNLIQWKASELLRSIMNESSSYNTDAPASTMTNDEHTGSPPHETSSKESDVDWPADFSLFDTSFTDCILDFELGTSWSDVTR